MPTIEELNKAIETIREECKEHQDCRFCPMDMCCNYSLAPFEWDPIEDGDTDDR